MDVQRDFRDLLASFNAQKVEYIVVGACALARHGAPRYTGDLGVLVRPTPDSARRVMDALTDFGFGDVGLKAGDFEIVDKVVQLGVPPVRIDLMTSIAGVSWDAAFSGRVEGPFGDLAVPMLGKIEFIANKRAAGRKKDLADIEALGEE